MTGRVEVKELRFKKKEESRRKNINNSFVFMRAECSYTIFFLSSLRAIFLRLFLLSFGILRSVFFSVIFVLHLMLCNVCIRMLCFLILFLALIMMFVYSHSCWQCSLKNNIENYICCCRGWAREAAVTAWKINPH